MIDIKILEQLKKKLIATEAQLAGEIAELKKNPDMGSDVDAFDEETDEAEEFSANQGALQDLKERYQNVKDALGKMTDGDYGMCEKDKQPIEIEILTVDPESRYCKACKLKLQVK
jgi:DnaK suppressor protein